MSYARFSKDSSVYVFLATGGWLECCGCSLSNVTGDILQAFTTQQMLDHLQEHIDAGHKVPELCLTRLEQAREDNDAWIRERRGLNDPTAGVLTVDAARAALCLPERSGVASHNWKGTRK